ncbi:MAG: sulfur carrier protein ThiS [Candidatus Margulisiibacteriota bacterium]|nr:sulfur carrier protein ThiS [Candidatus Margulisiibacteriota bacterium]
MQLVVNGESKDYNINDLQSLLDHLDIKAETVVVEKNGQIIARKTNCQLADGDKLEIVRFVGGG